MKYKIVLVLLSTLSLLSFSLPISANDNVDCPPQMNVGPDSDKLSKFAGDIAVATSKISDDNKTLLEVASTYLMAISKTNDFKIEDARLFTKSLTPICENKTLDEKFRSKACTRLSGIHGVIAKKLQMSGVTDGKNAFHYLKEALKLDPDNRDAIIGHATTVAGIYDQGFFVRKLVEANLGTSFKKEAQIAKDNLERLNMTHLSTYDKILEILK